MSYIVPNYARIAAANARSITGVLLTRPVLSSFGEAGTTYVANVKLDSPNVTYVASEPMDHLHAVEQVNELKNVPIASDNRLLIYADVGLPVLLSRNEGGRFQITGFAKTLVGNKREVIMVDLCADVILSIEDATSSSSPMPFGSMITSGGYGTAAYGLTGVYLGGTLIGTRS